MARGGLLREFQSGKYGGQNGPLKTSNLGSCADTVELKVEDMSTGNCFVYSCRKTMPLTEVWESLGSV